MNKKMQKLLSLILAMLMCITSLPLFAAADEVRQPREWFVALNGDDETGTGTIDKPFKTLQKGADMLKAGDTLYIREGVYDEFFKMNSSGTAEAPITIKPYNDENVVIRATDALTNWSGAGKNIWTTKYPHDRRVVNSLTSTKLSRNCDDAIFVGEEQYIVARHPNLPEGGSVLFPTLLEMDPGTRRHDTELKRLGTIVDAELDQPDGYWNGAYVHMQPGLNWYNVEADILDFKTGVLSIGNHTFVNESYYLETAGNPYYIEGHINALDTKGEYYIDYDNQTIYIYSETNPNTLSIGARARDYVCDLSDVSYVDVIGLDFRGATPKLSDNSSHINFEWISVVGIGLEIFKVNGSHNTVKHSYIAEARGTAIEIYGDYNALFNCLIEETNWYGSGAPGASSNETATHAYVAYNTMRNSGRTTFAPTSAESIFEYNDFYDTATITHDTGYTYTSHGGAGTSELRYNWFHNKNVKAVPFGLYYDNSGNSVAIHHNVVWSVVPETGVLRKDGWNAILLNDPSENFSVYNNTFIGDVHMGRTMAITNDTRYINNIFTGEIQSVVGHKTQVNNMLGWMDPKFKDEENLDFTLSPDSLAIDSGIEIEGVTDGYLGEAPDLGAYEYGGEYWVPGHDWENPPVFEHKTPNYIKWHNQVTMASFEDDQNFNPSETDKTRIWNPDKYGWSIMKETQGEVDQEFYHSLSVYNNTPKRIGNIGVKLGATQPTEYPGDESAFKATDIVNAYNEMTDGWVNYPNWKKEKIYSDLPDVIHDLLVNSTNMMPLGDFEDGEFILGAESSARVNTDEIAYEGTRSLKISDMRYQWSGMRSQLPATGHKKFRISAKIKGDEDASFQFLVDDHHAQDWDNSEDRRIGGTDIKLSGTDWDNLSLDVDTKGATSGIRMMVNYGNWNGGTYYVDNMSWLDITELYKMQEACAINLDAKNIIDALIADRELTAEKYAQGMRDAAKLLLEADKDKAIKVLVPLLTELRNSKVSPGAGITYTVKTLKPGRTYKLMCHAWTQLPEDKVQYFVKDGENILAQWETSSQDWTDEFITFTAPESGRVKLEIWKPQGKAAAWVDDVTVHEYDPVVYKLRSGAKYIENNDMEEGELWPWYSLDGDLELVPTDKGTSLKVTNGRAMQEVRTLPTGKQYEVSADVKLAMPGVASKEVEINIHVIEGTSNGDYITYPMGKAKVTNDGWTHIEGVLDVSRDLRFDSMGYTIGIVGGEGSFYLENAKVEELPMPTTPGTGDGMTFEQMMADTKNWISTSGEQGLSLNKTSVGTTNGFVGYWGNTLRDTRITFDMKIDGFHDGNYPSLTLRCSAANPTYGSGYTFIIKKDNIELQKYAPGGYSWLFVGPPEAPTGIYGPAKFSDAFKMGEWNTITVGTSNEEKGVRIYLEVNGEVYYDYLDVVSTIDNAGYLVIGRNGADKIEIRNSRK